MNSLERQEWKRRLRNTVAASMRNLGRKPTKQELAEAQKEMMKLFKPKEPDQNWKSASNQPKSIKDILGLANIMKGMVK